MAFICCIDRNFYSMFHMLRLLFWLPVRINSPGLIPKFTCVVKSVVLMGKEMVKGGIWRLILCRLLVEHKIFTDN